MARRETDLSRITILAFDLDEVSGFHVLRTNGAQVSVLFTVRCPSPFHWNSGVVHAQRAAARAQAEAFRTALEAT